MAWHSAGTYRTGDGRGGASSGTQRFAPLNSWPDNANLDKARRLLWPVKAKYGRKLSWADLMILAGNVAIESMGGPVFGFGGGRADVWEPEKDIYWGTEEEWLGATRIEEESGPRARESPGGDPDGTDLRQSAGAGRQSRPAAIGARHPRDLRAHGDERRGDPRAHRRRPHLRQVPRAGDAAKVGAEPEGADIAQQGLGWQSGHESGMGDHTITSGLEGAWTPTPIRWTMNYFRMLLEYEYELVKSPAGARSSGQPIDQKPEDMAPGAHSPERRLPTMMTTADMAFKMDPGYRAIAERFYRNPDRFADAFARAWFKLTHRDMGPRVRYLGPEVPEEDLIWQDPVPPGQPLSDTALAILKAKVANSGLSVGELVKTAWASASTFRGSDKRGGANGARIRLAPQNGLGSQRARQSSPGCSGSMRASRPISAAGSASPT